MDNARPLRLDQRRGHPPTADTLAWAARSVDPQARVRSARPFNDRSASWRLDLAGDGVATVVLRAGDPGDEVARQHIVAEVAALTAAASGGIRAPRLIANDVTGADASQLAILTTFLEGSSVVPSTVGDARLRKLGRAAALLAGIDPDEQAPLPDVDRALQAVDFHALRAAGHSTTLLDEAERAISAVAVPAHRRVLVHGDCWQGNMMWRGETFVGFVDWESAGRGPAGIDLGYLRMDVAVHFGPDRVDAVLAGWIDADGPALADLAYFDVLAGLSTPADLRDWVPVLAAGGRADLDAETISARRDRFLADALARLGFARS
jgi:aminoglycoside phosphotransferase (APT) family kinase protein